MKTKTKILISGIFLLAIAGFVVAQGINLGGSGGSLGLRVEPNVENHAWKNCRLANLNLVTFDYRIQEIDEINEWFTWQGKVNITNRQESCEAGLGTHTVRYDTNRGLTPRMALANSIRKEWQNEYEKNHTIRPKINLRGNYTQ